MRKVMLSLLLGLSSMASSAYEIDTEACAGTEYIYNQSNELVEYDSEIHTFVDDSTPVFYAGKEIIPHLSPSGTSRAFVIIIMNTSNNIVNFFYKPTYYDVSTGNSTTYSGEILDGSFSSTNDPRDAGGATMLPNTLGSMWTKVGGDVIHGHAEILWDSSSCLAEAPMLTFVENRFSVGTKGFATGYYVNQGNPW